MEQYKLYFLSLLLSFLLAKYTRVIALKYRFLIDKPNDRSLHTRPTVRGGGLVFVLMFVCISLYCKLDVKTLFFTVSIAILGFVDDFKPLSASFRFILQILFSFLYLYFSNYNYAYLLILTFFLVWMINSYNFMDGINGLAASQAIFFLLSVNYLHIFAQGNTQYLLLLSASILGFVFLNFPRAYLFMGDVGSGFLGALISVIILEALKINFVFAISLLILMTIFIVDTAYTLIVRILCKQNVLKAHANHAYQHAAILLKSHVKTTILVWVINVFWLLPLAFLVASFNLFYLYGLLLAYLPIVALSIYLRAGLPK